MEVKTLIEVKSIYCIKCSNVEHCQLKRNYVHFATSLIEHCHKFVNLPVDVEIKCREFKEKE